MNREENNKTQKERHEKEIISIKELWHKPRNFFNLKCCKWNSIFFKKKTKHRKH